MPPAMPALNDYLDFGCIALDLGSRILIDSSGRDVALRRREFDLLLALARNPGRVMSRDTLLDAIAGREAEAFDRTIDVYVGRLRQKIEKDPKQPRLIVTVPGVGYRLAIKPRGAQGASPRHSNEGETRAGLGILTAFNKANAERNARAISALYAADATMIKSSRLLHGRPTIEDDYVQLYENYSPNPSKLEHVAAIGNEMMLRAGSWSGTYHGQDGPVPLSGSWATTDVRDGTAWKIHSETSLLQSGSNTTISSVDSPVGRRRRRHHRDR
jgi:DNA-binding winged helix-turn-helix (wHTH) protein